MLTKKLLATVLATLSTGALAATATSSMTVSADVVASCSITAGNLAFGNYTLAQIDATSTLTLTCTNGTSASVGLSAGNGTGATVSNRLMSATGGATLAYGLYQDAARTTPFGNTGGAALTSTGTGSAQSFTVFGRVPANQTSKVGSYTDTVIATITY